MITELRTFLAVVRHGGFARAGEHIGLTQGAVSGHIQRLEEQIGHTLFDRTGRRAILTPAGREVHRRAEDIVSAVTELGKLDNTTGTRGTLALGAITSAQQSWLMKALAAFRVSFPGMSVRVLPGASLNILGQIDSGEIDLAVMVRPPFIPPPEIHWHSLLREPFVALVPADYSGNNWQAALHDLPYIRYDRSSFGGRAIDLYLRREQINVQDALELDEVSGLVQAVEHGIGVAIVPMTAAYLPYSDKLRVLPLTGNPPFREIGIAQRSVCRYPEITNQLVKLIDHCAASSAQETLPIMQHYNYASAYVGDGPNL
ncbi:LysR family transcriptional regulator [Pusillimonas sp. ANT_WB101]|uniref:LysR family transcriptional regulator n=1 Tax=Pusillimonas sp. ANT_WB101 TaxID=2597356 RepID=UPI0011EEE013|nr:LysR family transcriptional regulator [Pusillimonas sp. ANT_WB101]KAA0911321.1 LysR family transcriptional regulator [Pusillimonas sp. ANT_WB101]